MEKETLKQFVCFSFLGGMFDKMFGSVSRNIIRAIIFTVLVFGLFCSNGSAQIIRSMSFSGTEQDLELLRRESAVSERIQTQLEETLKKYYEKNAFVADVKVHLARVVAGGTGQYPSSSESSDIELGLPGLPVPIEQSGSKNMEQFIYDKLVYTNDYKIRFMEIVVLVNDKIIKESDSNFIKSVIMMRAGFDELRGDTFALKPMVFPTMPVTAEEAEKAKIDAQKALASVPEKNVLPPYYGIFVGLVVILIILQILSLIKKPNQKSSNLPMLGMGKNISGEQVSQAVISSDKKALLASSADSSGRDIRESEDNPSEKDLFYELRQLMVTTLVGNPGLSSEIFRQWIETDKDDGIYQTAAFFKATDPHLTELVAEYLGTELRAKIDFAMNQMVSFDRDGISETFKRFREDFQKQQYLRSVQGNGNQPDQKDMFQFMKQLDAHQIYHVVKDEEVGIIAVVLAQVAADIANAVIKELPQEKQDRIPIEMGKLKKIPFAVYRDISNRLAKKAVEAGQIKYVTTDGVEALLKMLEGASPEQEKQILDNIREQDIALANEVRKFYLPFEELTRLPDKYLADVVRSLDREIVIKALINSSKEIQEKIINNLGPRVRVIVSDAIENAEDIPLEQVASARKEITRKISGLAKTGKLDLAKLIS
ncbi:MAG: Flagellar motor switch protein FliG [Elusimicrobia bacterium ADurb.Bin231]|nr:MAG: Flagellar motor switch protein FliG [Elusimicrobia bacterium ADurb.Bin231]